MQKWLFLVFGYASAFYFLLLTLKTIPVGIVLEVAPGQDRPQKLAGQAFGVSRH